MSSPEVFELARDLHSELDELRGDVLELGRRVAVLEAAGAPELGRHSVRVPSSAEAIELEHSRHLEELVARFRGELGAYWR